MRIAIALLLALALTACQNSASSVPPESIEEQPSISAAEPLPESSMPEEPAAEAAAFAALRATVPHRLTPYRVREIDGIHPPTDETAARITEYLSRLGRLEEEITTLADLEPGAIAVAMIWATEIVSVDELYDYETAIYAPQLLPLTHSIQKVEHGYPPVGESYLAEPDFWLREHLDATTTLFLGKDYADSLDWETVLEGWKYRYFPHEGIVTPPHIGGGYSPLPQVLSYEKTENGYIATVVMLYDGMGGLFDWSADPEKEFPQGGQALRDWIATAPRREITLSERADGSLQLVSQHFVTEAAK